MLKPFKWLDDNIISILAGFLLVFIPLYPKIPLFDILPGYIVRVRLEDFFVSFTVFLFIIWLIRKKVSLKNLPLISPLIAYLLVGLFSMVSAIFITQTIPYENLHISKMFLHYLRRIEYFSLLFIFYSGVKSLRTLKIYLGLMVVTITAIIIYGFGQKYLYWPAFSTMNREFSKGWVLYLTEHARVLSTFGGHYDLAAYIMIALIILWSIFFIIRNWLIKLIILIIISGSFWLLVLTASRISFIAYLIGVSVFFFFWVFRKGILWSMPRWFIIIFLSMFIMLSFGDLSERYSKLLRVGERLDRLRTAILTPKTSPPTERAIFLENNPRTALIEEIAAKSDKPPIPIRPLPSDVYKDIPLMLVPTATDSSSLSAIPRTYSRNAFIYDLSTAIRFDALWPQAIKGFQKNLLLGSGYSTLNKVQMSEFTEAESTDNDYLRSLGETGILGFITFFGTLLILLIYVLRRLFTISDPLIFSLSVALISFVTALLVNAALIDVFEASKVAFGFWGLIGLILAGINLTKKNENASSIPGIPDWRNFIRGIKSLPQKAVKSNFLIILLILVLAFVVRLHKINNPLADWHSFRQADTSSVTRNYVKNGINLLFPTYDDLSNIQSGKDNPRGLRFVEFPIYNVFSVFFDNILIGLNLEISGRLVSIFSTLLSIIFLFHIVKKNLGKKEAVLTSLLYAILPYNIYFTRVILPEPFFVMTTLGMIYFFDKWIEESFKLNQKELDLGKKLRITLKLIFALIFTSISLLVKPYSVFLFPPLFYLWLKGYKITIKSILGLTIFIILSVLPFILWRKWISHFPEGTPAYDWLFNGDEIRFKGAFFYWILAERLSKLILGYWGLPLFLFGIMTRPKKEGWLFYWWGLGLIAYIIVFATGNVRHDYYQIVTIPIIVIFMAKGISSLLEMTSHSLSKISAYTLIIVMIVLSEAFGWYQVRDFYNINHPEIVEAGNAVDKLTSDKALVIAPYFGDTAFLYQTKRAGWPIMQEPVNKMIDRGADYYVSVNFDDLTNSLISEANNPDPKKKKYKIIDQTTKYVIIQLVPDAFLRI